MKLIIKSIFTIVLFFVFSKSFSQPAYPISSYCTDSSRECLISTAKKYLDAVVSHNPSEVPLHDKANRWENAVNTGNSSEKIRDSLKNDIGFKSVRDIRDIEWYVDGNVVIAIYLLDVVIPYSKIYYGTTHITEKFEIENGLIKNIEATFCSSGLGKEESKRISPSYAIPFICSRNIV